MKRTHLNFRADPDLADTLRGYADFFGRGLGAECALAVQAWCCLLHSRMARSAEFRAACNAAELDRQADEADQLLEEILAAATAPRPSFPSLTPAADHGHRRSPAPTPGATDAPTPAPGSSS